MFHRDFPAALNYGAIGAVVGHEITHGFDDQGRKFDPKGELREWWEPAVAEKFESRAQCVDDFYSGFEVAPGVNVNGRLTLGENIADVGGVKQAHQAYRRWQERHGDGAAPAVPGLTDEQLFFVAYAQVWCSLSTPEEDRLRITTDPHSPPKFRVRGTLAQVPAFAAAFACAEGAPMNPAERCEVW
jgi:endothelin-converting enzyme/putative endopeptidase